MWIKELEAFVDISTPSLLLDFGFQGWSFKGALKELSEGCWKAAAAAGIASGYGGGTHRLRGDTWINLYNVEKPV